MTLGNALPHVVSRLLAEGYGVEDIALKLKCKPLAVRSVIWDLKHGGQLGMFYANARMKWRAEKRNARN